MFMPIFMAAALLLTADRESRLYPMASNAVVTVTAIDGGVPLDRGTVRVRVSNDGGKETYGEFTRDLAKGNPFTVVVPPKKPGFAFVEATLENGKARGAVNLGFAVERIRVESEEPSDFDAWWRSQFAAQAAIEDAVTLTRVSDPAWDARYRYYLVKTKTAADEGCVYGFLGVPKTAGKKFGCIVVVQCAGAGYLAPETNYVRPDMMTLALNVHPWDPTAPGYREFFKKECAKSPKGRYIFRGCSSRERFYLRNAVLGCKATVDHVLGRGDFNGELFYLGTSQGGGFGLILGGIYAERFRALCIQVPAMCDLFGSDAGRVDGWPGFGSVTASREMAYYDAAFWARRVRAPVHFTIGMMDRTCVASGTMAAYNAIPRMTPKFLQIGADWAHATTWQSTHLGAAFLQNFMADDCRMPATRFWKVKK